MTWRTPVLTYKTLVLKIQPNDFTYIASVMAAQQDKQTEEEQNNEPPLEQTASTDDKEETEDDTGIMEVWDGNYHLQILVTDDITEFLAVTIGDIEGNPVTMKEILGDTPTILVALRHFGW